MPEIFVALLASGRKVTPDVETTDRVEALRRKIHALVEDGSAAPELQLLMFGERVLEDGHTLAEYEIQKESELTVALRPRQVPIRLDVGGSCFSATLETLQAVEGSRLAAMFEPLRRNR